MTSMRKRIRGQGMTEYIIIVALIAIGAIAVYTAFGDVVRGQTGRAAAALAGADGGTADDTVTAGGEAVEAAATAKTLENFNE
jgi:type IV pilus assembly protein PilA